MCNFNQYSSVMENRIGQGKSEEQYKGSMIGAAIGFAGIIITLILSSIFSWAKLKQDGCLY